MPKSMLTLAMGNILILFVPIGFKAFACITYKYRHFPCPNLVTYVQSDVNIIWI